MHVYDFDQTIFQYDSSVRFFQYCLRHYTRPVVHAVPLAALRFAEYQINGSSDAKKLKERLFSFLNRIDNIDAVVHDFWEENWQNFSPWYLDQKEADDLIISASPEFLLRPAAEHFGFSLIATMMNPYTGKIEGKNCHDYEKKRRFLAEYPNAMIEAFYSDSLSDSPMAEIAESAWLVKRGEIVPWPKNK